MTVSSIFQAVNAETIREVCNKYIYNRSPAIAAVGKPGFSSSMQKVGQVLLINCLLFNP